MAKENKVNIRIDYSTNKRPYVDVSVHEVTDGVYYINFDFFERFYPASIGWSSNGEVFVVFDDGKEESDIIFTVFFKFPDEGMGWLFPSSDKKCAHATYFEDKVFDKVLKNKINRATYNYS